MESWRLIDLGKPEPYVAQAFYEAVAESVERGVSENTLIMLQPGSPYACIGFHQDLVKEIDIEFCRSKGLPIIRRGQGGGATYLDGNQVFYQIVAKNSRVVPREVERQFERLLSVTVKTYQRFGLDAEFKPLNDVVVKGKKVSGNGAGLYESTSILVGNIILDLDYDMMARVLKVPDEKFRDKLAKSMRDWVTSLKAELGEAPSSEEVKEVYVKEFQKTLNVKLKPSKPNSIEWEVFHTQVKPKHLSKEWLYMETPISQKRDGRSIKVAGPVKVVEADYKAKKLIRVRAEIKGYEILNIQIHGDFFAIPEKSINSLETLLTGTTLDDEKIHKIVESFYHNSRIQTPGVRPEDFAAAILKIKNFID
ncbi:lipoate--protein ligase family protein [Candidatus Bathyarchaeota archaeon]|nr:lipoate--protein ligase family protein [Candidatus Bathyarchaeota archaeon]MBS7631427.1 lipoate--protein ligase family protein [Candidatus Bathyarchaeota archaeon]